MILPSKHIRVAESIFGLAGFIIAKLEEPATIDELWQVYLKANDTKRFPAYHGFDQFILAIDFLFVMNAVDINSKGELYNASTGTTSE